MAGRKLKFKIPNPVPFDSIWDSMTLAEREEYAKTMRSNFRLFSKLLDKPRKALRSDPFVFCREMTAFQDAVDVSVLLRLGGEVAEGV